MSVVVLDELAQHYREMAGSGDQQVIEALAAQRADPALGDRVGPRRLDWGADDADVGAGEDRVEKAAVNLLSRSRIKNRDRSARSPRSMNRLRACWVIQALVGGR